MLKRMSQVVAVAMSPRHAFSKDVQQSIRIVAGFGVVGDAHAGELVQHLYRVRQNPRAPNRTQVHLLGVELFAELGQNNITLAPGEMGENITTAGLDLLALPLGTLLHLGSQAVIELTGLRTPCSQMNKLRPGLMKACMGRHPDGSVARKAGVMGIALADGVIAPGDTITVELPDGPARPLTPV
jgi:MOSC domain-containing protein YiiM